MEADLELDGIQSKLTIEVGKYVKNFRYHSDQPKNLAQKVEDTINAYNKINEELLLQKFNLDREKLECQQKVKAAACKNARMF